MVTPVARRAPVHGEPVGTAEWGDRHPSQLSDAERADRLDKLQGIMDLMRPAVQADGGDLVLVRADVETGSIEVQLQGACSSCAISSATLSGGVERILRERLPWVTEVDRRPRRLVERRRERRPRLGRLRPEPLRATSGPSAARLRPGVSSGDRLIS